MDVLSLRDYFSQKNQGKIEFEYPVDPRLEKLQIKIDNGDCLPADLEDLGKSADPLAKKAINPLT